MRPNSGGAGAGFPKRNAGWLAAVILQAAIAASTAQEATLRGTIEDEGTGALTPCTVTITDAKGKVPVENDSFKSGFRCSGQFTKRLPPGRTRIRVTRGFETEAVERELELPAGQETELTLVLRRRVDLRKRGWYGGDSHAHMLHGERTVPVDFDFVALTARAEDLRYLCLAQNWTVEPATPEALEAELKPRSTRDCLLSWNLEAPKNYYQGDAGRCLGHCWNVGMRGRTAQGLDVIHLLLEASAWDYESSKPTYANFESQALIHAQGGAVFYTHPARWWMGSWGGQGGYPKVDRMRVSNMAVELPLDTLAGPTYDGLDVITTGGESAANAKAFQLWSLLLNHGYRLAATASSDACFDRPGGGVPGIVRTYTFVTGQFSLAKVAQATAAGKNLCHHRPFAHCHAGRGAAGLRAGRQRAKACSGGRGLGLRQRCGRNYPPRVVAQRATVQAGGLRRAAQLAPHRVCARGERECLVLRARSGQRCPKTNRAQRRLLFRGQKLSASPARSGASPGADCRCSIGRVPPRLADGSDF